jgi:hypothetical protein
MTLLLINDCFRNWRKNKSTHNEEILLSFWTRTFPQIINRVKTDFGNFRNKPVQENSGNYLQKIGKFQATSQNVNIWLIGHIESLNFNSAVFIGSQIEKGNRFLYNYIQFNPVVVILITHKTTQYNSVNLI